MKWKLGLICLLGLASCAPSGVFEKAISFSNSKWHHTNQPSFQFAITDTLAPYKIFLYLRHTDAYPYSNIWLNIYTQVPGNTKPLSSRIELPLANDEGKWYAQGMNEIREHKIPLNGNGTVHFNKTGLYEIQLEQIMRTDPLPEVLSAGIFVEKQTK
jgi:gliding motility-associated lipoprotein GldH